MKPNRIDSLLAHHNVITTFAGPAGSILESLSMRKTTPNDPWAIRELTISVDSAGARCYSSKVPSLNSPLVQRSAGCKSLFLRAVLPISQCRPSLIVDFATFPFCFIADLVILSPHFSVGDNHWRVGYIHDAVMRDLRSDPTLDKWT